MLKWQVIAQLSSRGSVVSETLMLQMTKPNALRKETAFRWARSARPLVLAVLGHRPSSVVHRAVLRALVLIFISQGAFLSEGCCVQQDNAPGSVPFASSSHAML